ncbi:hypothetical protein [Microcoleus sp. MON2_D5]|uniref:hypothetical protein n=1 Tax=Microcoleus sp. MON2_D5 TaxID=2818833 RepID=UPI002FCEB728
MTNKIRNTAGKFAPKSEAPRKVRSVNLTDETWQRLAAVAEKTGKSRNDFLESLLQGNNPFIETVAIHMQPVMEMVQVETETDGANVTQQHNSSVLPLIETAHFELEALKQELADAKGDYLKLLESSLHVTSKLRQEVQELQQELEVQVTNCDEFQKELENKALVCVQLQSQLEQERADRKEIETQLSELKQNSAPAAATSSDKTLPDAAQLLSQLRGKRKKSKVDLGDIETLLGLLGG